MSIFLKHFLIEFIHPISIRQYVRLPSVLSRLLSLRFLLSLGLRVLHRLFLPHSLLLRLLLIPFLPSLLLLFQLLWSFVPLLLEKGVYNSRAHKTVTEDAGDARLCIIREW